MSVADKWGFTQVKINKCTYTWTISNFSYLRKKTGEELESPCFSIGAEENSTWYLKLYINGINDSFKNYISLYLQCKSSVKFEGQYTLSILNNKQEKFFQRTEDCQYNALITSWGFPDFVKIEEAKYKANGLLVNDSVTFHCEISMITGSVNISSESVRKTQRQQSLREKASNYLEKLFLDENFSDVKLVTTCGRELPAHKGILAAKSATFEAMFKHDMLEKKSNTVEITDVRYDVLKEMLRFVYTTKVENIENMANELLAAADKYEIDKLKDLCEEVLCDTITVDNVVEILVVADRHNIDHLKMQALNFIKAHIKDVIDSEGFKSIVQENLVIELIRTIVLQ